MKQHMKIFALALAIMLACLSIVPLSANAAEAWTTYGKNGHATASGDTVSFRGHPKDPFTSLLFRDASDGDYRVLTFHLTEGLTDWHTIEGSGFIFNAGTSNGLLSGNAVLFAQSTVNFYELTNVPLSQLSSSQFTACSGVSQIDSKGRPNYSSGSSWYLKLVMSPTTMQFEKHPSPDYTGTPDVIFSKSISGKSGASGYGPFASFISHDCETISTSVLEYFSLTITPNTPPTIAAPDVVLQRGEAFATMDGVSANDAEDGNLTSQVKITANTVDTAVPDVYTVSYAVADIVGASTAHTRKVTVLADAVWQVVDAKTKAPISGVGISISEPKAQALEKTNSEGSSSIAIVEPNSYEWKVSTQHEDYLPDTKTYKARIDRSGTSTWPMVIPLELTRKYRDVGVELTLSSIDEKEAKEGDTARYGQTVYFALTLTNHGNEAVIPTVTLAMPEGLRLENTQIIGKALQPDESETIPIQAVVTNLAATQTLELKVALHALVLDNDENTAVQDEKAENNEDAASLQVKNTPITLRKINAVTGKPLEGVELQLQAKNLVIKVKKQADSSYMADESGTDILTTDKDGKAVLYGLFPGQYEIVEVKELPGYAVPAAPWLITIDENGQPSGYEGAPQPITLKNSPLALFIKKVTKQNQPLTGAGFTLKAKDKSDALMFTKDDKDIYWYDAQGKEKTILVNDKGDALVYGLPQGEYSLEETIVPKGYVAAIPQKIIITNAHDTEKPLVVTVVNEVFVQLGFNWDRWVIPGIAVLLILATAAGLILLIHLKRSRE